MSKLIYRTKPPKKGYVFNESFSTHESTGNHDKMPPNVVQGLAIRLVSDELRKLTQKLEKLGYDATKVRFQIHFKN